MDREADVRGVRAHLDCERRLGNEVASRRPHNTAADDALAGLIEQSFRDAFVASK